MASFLAEVASCIPEVTIIRCASCHVENMVFYFSSARISSVDAAYIWLCECSGVGAGCYVVNIF